MNIIRIKQKLPSLLLGLIFSFTIQASSNDGDMKSLDSTALTQEVKKGMALWNVPALAVAVVDKNSVEFQQGFGQTAIKKGKKVTEHTLFSAASTTKAMVVASVLMLVDENKLSLDDLVIKYIPELHLNSESLTQQITIRDLLAHRTGLPSTDLWAFIGRNSLDDQIKKLRYVKSAAPLGSRFIYQNTMYELTGLIIERVSGKSWDEFTKERLWQPIGMKETYSTRGAIPRRKNHVLPYSIVDKKLKQDTWNFAKDYSNPAGSVWTSVYDMSLWAQFLLNDGVTAKGKRLISTESLEQMFTPQHLISKKDFYPVSKITKPNWRTYGFGWFQQDFQGRKIDFHTGSLSGLIAMIGLDRKNGKAFVALGNRDHAEARHALLWWVMDNNKTSDKRDWNQLVYDLYNPANDGEKSIKEKLEAARLKNTTPGLPLADYAGTYGNDTQGDISMSFNEGKLTMLYGKDTFEINHWHLDTFEMVKKSWDFKAFVSFDISPKGKIEKLNLFGEDFIAK